MPRKCHLCASVTHSVANCQRLKEIYSSHSALASTSSSIYSHHQNNNDDDNNSSNNSSSNNSTIHKIFERRNGLQHIFPYHHIFSVPVKGRWEGKKLSEALQSEFSCYPMSYFEPACQDGRLKLVWDLFHLRKAEKELKIRKAQMKQQIEQRMKNAEERKQRRQREEEDDGNDNTLSNNNATSDKEKTTTVRSQQIETGTQEETSQQTKKEEKQLINADDITFEPVSHPDTILKVGMIILHRVHRHEHPVLESVCPIEIVDFIPVPKKGQDQQNKNQIQHPQNRNQKQNRQNSSTDVLSLRGIIAVNKPPSLPVHSCGRYHFNTVQHMLRCGFWRFKKSEEDRIVKRILDSCCIFQENNKNDDDDSAIKSPSEKAQQLLQSQVFGDPEDAETSGLHSCHRLDRGTSGVLLFATCTEVSKLVVSSLREKSEEPELFSNEKDLSSSSSSASVNSPSKMSKVYLARVHGRVKPPPDAKFSEADPGFFYLQRSLFCLAAQEGRYSCLTAEQEIEAVKFRKEELAGQLKVEAEVQRQKMSLVGLKNNSSTNANVNNDDDGECNDTSTNQQPTKLDQTRLATMAEIQKLKNMKKERQAQICKGRNARGAFTHAAASATEQGESDSSPSSSSDIENENENENDNENTQQQQKKNQKPDTLSEIKNQIAIQHSKWAATWFKVLSYDNQLDESVVECHPVTGRTHQLRVHLAVALDNPIVGDDIYGCFSTKRKIRSRSGSRRNSLASVLNNDDDKNNNNVDDVDVKDYKEIDLEDDVRRLMEKLSSSSSSSSSFDPSPLIPDKDYPSDATCPDCTYNREKRDPHLVSGGSPVLALHAWRYRVKVKNVDSSVIDEEIVTDTPGWAK